MNIEELELSLRSEFEGQLNDAVARMRLGVTEFREKFEAELRRHREVMEGMIGELGSGTPESVLLDNAFKSTVTEHLRLARDEGAQIAATAFGEAEKLRHDTVPAANGKYDLVRDAINQITSKRSQAAILSALVENSSHFAARGAFFIVKNENFVGWRAFGSQTAEAAVRDISFTVKCHSTLSDAVGLLTTVKSELGAYADDINFLEPLGFGQSEEMYAIPLSARGRGVAVLFVDRAAEDQALNVEVLETLVRVAGLTVELLAAQAPKTNVEGTERVEQTSDKPTAARTVEVTVSSETEVENVSEPAAEGIDAPETVQAAWAPVDEPSNSEDLGSSAAVIKASEEVGEVSDAEPEPSNRETEPESADESGPVEVSYEFEPDQAYEFESTAQTVNESVDAVETTSVPSNEPSAFEPLDDSSSSQEFEFVSNSHYDASATVEVVENEVPHVEFAEEVPVASHQYLHQSDSLVTSPVVAAAPEVEVVQAAAIEKPRLRDRNVDLPIEVADEERKLHNDARRFARLLVSEIKLYNEEKVAEGRERSDLYERLREAIDRSREMYEKRVQPAVASKFDYFHYELVNGLAEGNAGKLGAGYPGASA